MEVRFIVTGGFELDEAGTPKLAYDKSIIGYEKNGAIVRLIVALEIEKDGKCEYVTSEKGMSDLGFTCLVYDRLDFEEI